MDPALDRLPCGFLSFADNGRITAVNASLCAMLGYERADLLAFLDSLTDREFIGNPEFLAN